MFTRKPLELDLYAINENGIKSKRLGILRTYHLQGMQNFLNSNKDVSQYEEMLIDQTVKDFENRYNEN